MEKLSCCVSRHIYLLIDFALYDKNLESLKYAIPLAEGFLHHMQVSNNRSDDEIKRSPTKYNT